MQKTVELAQGRPVLGFDFPTPAESRYRRPALLSLRVEPEPGYETAAVRLVPASATGLVLSLDVRTQRALSLWVISGTQR